MGSIGNVTAPSMTISDFKIEEKKWDARERDNLEYALGFMSREFGDIKDLIGNIYRRSSSKINASALYDRDGYEGKGRATYFATDGYASEDNMLHEFTHAVTHEIAAHYKQLGFKSEGEVYSAMRSQVYSNLGKEEPKYDGRKWADRPNEFLSRGIEAYTRADGNRATPEAKETLKVVKQWFKRIGR